MVIAAAGSGTAFLLNALSFFGVILVLYRWKRPAPERIETGALWDAVLGGIQYVRQSPLVRSVLIRTGAFSVGAIALLALLPILARPFGATGYGVLLGCFGMGALAGATLLPRLRRSSRSMDWWQAAIVVFALMTFPAGRVHFSGGLCAVMGTAGAAWIGILACLNTAAQTMCPSWVRARALSMYLLVLQGGMAIGSTMWGAVATRVGLPMRCCTRPWRCWRAW